MLIYISELDPEIDSVYAYRTRDGFIYDTNANVIDDTHVEIDDKIWDKIKFKLDECPFIERTNETNLRFLTDY